jgi:hypothetical protein
MDGPQCHWLESLVEGATIPPHFHKVDQFQVFTHGDGQFGKHQLDPLDVQYADWFTPYGPIVAGPEGFHFMTVRATPDPNGGYYMPASSNVLREEGRRAGRSFVQHVRVPELGSITKPGVTVLCDYDDGLTVQRVDLPPGSSLAGPDPSRGRGQHTMVVRGSLVHEGRAHPERTMLFVPEGEPALDLVAGPEGVIALVMGFPRR